MKFMDIVVFSVAGFMSGSLTFSMRMSVHAVVIFVMMMWILRAAYSADTHEMCARAAFVIAHFMGIFHRDFHAGSVHPVYMAVFVFAVPNVLSLFFLRRKTLKRREPAATELENEEA